MHESHDVEQNQSDTKKDIPYDSIYIKFQKEGKIICGIGSSGFCLSRGSGNRSLKGKIRRSFWSAGKFCFLISVYFAGVCFLFENLSGCKLDLCTFF